VTSESKTKLWTVLMILGAAALLARALVTGAGTVYERTISVDTVDPEITFERSAPATPNQRDEPGVRINWSGTIGTWIAAFLTLAVFSFLWGDNPVYKFAESVFIGVTAAYQMMMAFWSEIIPNLVGSLLPTLMKATLIPGEDRESPNWIYLAPLVMAVMMLMRLAPKGGWISKWPLAFFIGATAGVRLIGYLEADFVAQTSSTILPLIVMTTDGAFDFSGSLRNLVIVLSVLVTLVYFSFSVPHTGAVGGIARVGVWVLMITFGASFGYTVMGRIALLAGRMEFLFDDWLWLIDPLEQHG